MTISDLRDEVLFELEAIDWQRMAEGISQINSVFKTFEARLTSYLDQLEA